VSKHRLLLADDSVTIQKVVNLTFAEEGIEVITAGDGNSAMEKFVQSPPDLVMVDVNMPGLDGYKICEMIKQDDETKQIPVILLVGSFEPFDEAEARRVGADDYLTKPFQSIRQLVSRVSDLLNRSNGSNSLPNQDISNSGNQVPEAAATNFGSTSAMRNEMNFEPFNDRETDDEMIQTNQIGSLPADETQKFVSEPQYQTSQNNSANWGANEEDSEKTESFDAEEFEPIRMDSMKAKAPQFDEKIFEFADEQPSAREAKSEFAEQTTDAKKFPDYLAVNVDKNTSSEAKLDIAAKSPDASFFDFDDLNLLELPPPAKKPLPRVAPKPVIEEVPQKPEESIVEEKKDSMETTTLSPEVIEAIAKRVIEKLSASVVREIAHELTPQAVEAMIKETAQKKTN
jgi:DNA-binding response OmpR family regulator